MTSEIICGDVLEELAKVPKGYCDLVFADPPFNIKKPYLGMLDSKPNYKEWAQKWIRASLNILKDHGSIYVACNDETVSWYYEVLKQTMFMRNWIIWHYNFGEAQQKKFNRTKTHILYFVKDPDNFIFNDYLIRVPSERQIIGDKRASNKGKVPDDVWEFPRVAGTHAERNDQGHNCQMPEALMERIILGSTSLGSMVVDPFCGNGTTAAVCKIIQ